jgi:Flp pilus assembly protein TadG
VTGTATRAGLAFLTGRPRSRDRDDSGSMTLELVVWAPGLLLIISLLVVAGRVSSANAAVEQAAVEAARTASIARSPSAASTQALAAARESLAGQGLQCTDVTVTIDTSGFNTPPGRPATVTATVTCPVRLSDLTVPGLPGTRTVTQTAISSLDTFRERS